jgi:kinesin family protein 6/9
VTLQEDHDGRIHLRNLSAQLARNEEEALNLLFVGDTNRMISETPMNMASSRSHCIFTISIEARPSGSVVVRRSKLHLVDLAGSERVGKSGASGTTLTEAIHINSSLFQLELVIMALHERQTASSRHVPYRNSMLTSVLRDSLGGNCKTVMVATVHPAVSHTDESISTCKFAQRVAMVKNEVSVNEEVDQAVLIARLQDENRKLREAGGGAGGSAEDDPTKQLSAEELQQLHRDVRAFVSDADPQVTLAWGPGKRLAKVRHALWILKGLLLEGWRPHRAPPAEAWSAERLARSAPAPTAGVVAAGAAGASGGVGTGGGGGGDEGPSSTTGGTRAADEAEAAEVRERREELLRRADDAPPLPLPP